MWLKRRREAKEVARSFWAVVEADEELREQYGGEIEPDLAKMILERLQDAGIAMTTTQAGEYADAIREGTPFDIEVPVDGHLMGVITTAADDDDWPIETTPEVEPSAGDIAVRDAVERALRPHRGAFQIEHVWGAAAGMWFTEVTPSDPNALSISTAYDNDREVICTVGNAHFDLFGDVFPSTERLEQIVAAAAAGHVEEAGATDDASMRFFLVDGSTFSVGPISRALLVPWRWRTRRTYPGYS